MTNSSDDSRQRNAAMFAPEEEYGHDNDLTLLLQHTEESFLLLNHSLDIVYFNAPFAKFYLQYSGISIQKGHNMVEDITPEFQAQSIEIYRKVLQGATVFTEVACNQQTYSIKHKPARDANNLVVGIFIIVTDTTERTSAYQQMVANEKRFRSLIENGADGVVIFDVSARPFYVSPATTRILGYTEEEAKQLDLFSLTHPHDATSVQHAWEYVLNNPGVPVVASSSRLLHKDGTWRWLEGTLTNMLHDPAIAGIMDNFRDITDKIQSRKEISERQRMAELAEANYREIFEKANDGIIICEINTWRLVDLNSKSCEILGRSKAEILTTDPVTFMSDVPGYSLYNLILKFKLAAVQGPQLFEWICKHKDGTLNWLEVNVQRASLAGEDKLLSFIRVINKRKLAEAHSEFERRDKEALINTTEDLIWSIDSQFRLIAANRAFTATLKAATGEVFKPGDSFNLEGKYPKAFLEFWRKLYQRALLGESFIEEILTAARPGFAASWAEVRFNPIFDKELITGVACYSRDTTAAREVKNHLIDINKKLATAQQIAHLGYWKQDISMATLYWSDEVFRIWETTPQDFVPSLVNFFDTIHPDDRAVFVAAQQKVLEGKSSLDIEFRICIGDNKIKYVHVSGESTFNEARECTGIEGMVQDITERKQSELQLQELNQHLQDQANKLAATNKELEHFAYIASHDLQEPLRMVTSFLSLLEKKYGAQLDQQANQYIYFAVDGAKRMRQIILDLLDFSRVGRIEEDLEEIDLNDLVQEIKPLLLQENPAMAKATITIVGKLPMIHSFRTSLHQVFQNLLSNALKYTGEQNAPQITIQAFHDFTHWKFCVSDNGIGIDPEYFERIFVIFQRLHNRNMYPGTGIGLAIAKKIVENLGGRIWVESTPGYGSAFYFTIEKI